MQQHKTSRGRGDDIKIEEMSSKSFIKKEEGKLLFHFKVVKYMYLCAIKFLKIPELLKPLRYGSL